jgi:diaminohydroxyphosphoribosylaminopyrimidine deaminase/5-amino-6-(5-phosphoribosylamino)uracil reductase
MQRCFDLARLGAGSVSPNPMVGAVLVYQERIIGEGWHRRYGEAHAEVNAVRSVNAADQPFISQSTLYVSLEPCNIYGKTPPCTDLILQYKIPKVVISCLDQTPEVAGKGVALLRANGVEVITGILEEQGRELSRFRSHFVTHQRPYIILKFAQTLNGYFGKPGEPFWITNAFSKRLVHKWRSEVDAILVGTNTAKIDNPQLTNRLYVGKSPVRIVLDRHLQLSEQLHLFDLSQPTLVVTETPIPDARFRIPDLPPQNLDYLSIAFDQNLLSHLLEQLHKRKITTLLVEGGATLLQSFIQQNLWDEARILIGSRVLQHGIPAPGLSGELVQQYRLGGDQILCYQNIHTR